jgi:hypothetical protein
MQAFSFAFYRKTVFCEKRCESEQYGICKRYLDGYPWTPILLSMPNLSEFAAKQSHCFAKGSGNPFVSQHNDDLADRLTYLSLALSCHPPPRAL